MRSFHYTAVDREGLPVSGSVEASDWAAAAALLAVRGLADCRELPSDATIVLSTADAVELAGYLAELSKTGLPLSGTLQTLAQDASSPALRRAIDDLSTQLAAGQPLENAIEALGSRLPEHVRRLLGSAARSGRLSQTLERLLLHERSIADMGRRLRQAIAYPSLLFGLLLVWMFAISMWVLPQFISVLGDYHDHDVVNLMTSPAEAIMIVVARWLPTMLVVLLTAAIALPTIVAIAGGRAALSRLLGLIPVVGPCWRNRGVADFCGLLAEFIDQQLPLEESLRLAALGVHDPALRAAAVQASHEVAQGSSLSQSLRLGRTFPDTLQQWCQWGQAHGNLPKALRAASTLFSERFALRLQLLRAILPAIVFASIGTSAVLLAFGVFYTLFQLVHYLIDYSVQPAVKGPNVQLWIAVGAGALFVLGSIVLFVARVMRNTDETIEEIITAARYIGCLFIAIALLVAFFVVLGPLGLIFWLLLMVAWWLAAARYRNMQRQSLWMTLSLAAECHAPLAPLALAFADEQRGSVSLAARRLARQLSAGAPLPEALAWGRGALPAEAPMAIRVGTDSGDLLGALRATAGLRGAGRPLMPAAVFWLLVFVPAILAVIIFMQTKIVPAYVTIFDDFGAHLPTVTVTMISLLNSGMVPFVLAVLALLPVITWLQWRGTIQPRLPVLARIVRWIELGPVLRMMALVTQRGEPLPPALRSIAQLHPARWLRRRFRAALGDLDRGLSWQESLRRRRLLNDSDLAVLAAAERNGNLSWALAEMGDSFDRRADFHIKAVSEFALPLLLASIGLSVALFVLACFVPLVNLIRSLS
jgi:type II secretory pathway component PulF